LKLEESDMLRKATKFNKETDDYLGKLALVHAFVSLGANGAPEV